MLYGDVPFCRRRSAQILPTETDWRTFLEASLKKILICNQPARSLAEVRFILRSQAVPEPLNRSPGRVGVGYNLY